MKTNISALLMTGIIGLTFSSTAQSLKGKVVEWDESMNMEMPMAGANVHWLSTTTGAATDDEGNFKIDLPQALPAKLITTFIGYKEDTTEITNSSFKKILIKKAAELKEVTVEARQNSLGVSTLNPINVETVTGKELLKAACCNLSESFETNPTVTVAYRDAVTGAKEIQLLGLAGIYSQLLTENIPNMQGLAGIYGLTFIPGPWMESIQIVEGAGSVVNGYESTTGQINIEFLKPQDKTTPQFYLNLYGAQTTNTELNTFFKHQFNKKWSTMLMAHGNYMENNIDVNHDGFLDMPHDKQINLFNRWEYDSGKNLLAQFGVKYLYDDIVGGRVHPGSDDDVNREQYYIASIITNRAEAYGKLGFVFPDQPYKSIGNIVQVTYHDMQSEFGLKNFDGLEKSLYYESIYQNIIGSTANQYKIGWTYNYDNYNQTYLINQSVMNQSVPGVFGEYTYSYLNKFTVIAGAREDYHNEYKWIFTPRLHLKYNFTDNFIVRASAGKSFRVPYVLADNISLLETSRQLLFPETIQPERAWNYGINFTYKFKLNYHDASLNVDLYRTDFINQLVVDQYTNPNAISFYNLNGTSYSNSFQATFSYELIKKLDLRLAYKLDDVQETYNGTLEEKPLVPKDRALANIAYATSNDHWKFDYTIVWVGQQKLANTVADPVYGSLPAYSPDYITMNIQLTKVFKKLEIYSGIQNIFDYRQLHPIIGANNPFGNSFDATQVWGPIEGRRIYAGLRYSIE